MVSEILVGITLIIILFLGFIALRNNFKSSTNVSFFTLTLFLVLWALANFLENANIPFDLRTLFLKLDFFLGLFVAYFWLLFSIIFLLDDKSFIGYIKKNVIILIPILAFLPLTLNNLIINNITLTERGINFNFGLLFVPYALIIVCYLFGGLYILLKKYRNFTGIEKIQVLYVLLGLLISATITLTINLILQNFISVEITRFGIYSFIFIVGFTTYAIIKHHLMNIKVIATELFSVVLIFITFIEIFLSASFNEILFRSFIFLVTLVFVVLLIHSVLNEVRRREEMEELNKKLKKITEALAVANKELKQLDEAKSEFISIASHQLRTPLTAIKGFGSMLLEGSYGAVPANIKNPLEKIYLSNERLIKLVENLLDISRIESGKQDFKWEKIHLESIAQTVVDNLKKIAKDKGLKLFFHKPQKPTPQVIADADKIHEVMMNFVDNAIKYTNEGKIDVYVKPGPATAVTFSVKDTGMGIRKEIKPYLFRKFSRGKGSFTVHTEGIGLGLYVAKMIIDSHQGRVWAESEGEGKGAKFCFSLFTNIDPSKVWDEKSKQGKKQTS